MNCLRISRLSKLVYNDRQNDKIPPMSQMIKKIYIPDQKR